jgi:prepilin-type N-terminal cleavage/methylation domain-containing protein
VHSKKGFTLIEIMIVVIIIGILVSVAMPLYNKVTEKARIADVVNILGALHEAEVRYALRYGTYTPVLNDTDMMGLNLVSPPYIGATKYFIYGLAWTSALCLTTFPNSSDDIDDFLVGARRGDVANPYSANYLILMQESGALYSNDSQVNSLFP